MCTCRDLSQANWADVSGLLQHMEVTQKDANKTYAKLMSKSDPVGGPIAAKRRLLNELEDW